MDISQKSVNETSNILLEDAAGEPIRNENGEQISITVYGPGSKQFQKAGAARNRKLIEQVRKNRAGDSREMDVDFLVECTVSFNGFSYKELTGNQLFKAVYSDISIGYIFDQVNRAIQEWGNFTKK